MSTPMIAHETTARRALLHGLLHGSEESERTPSTPATMQSSGSPAPTLVGPGTENIGTNASRTTDSVAQHAQWQLSPPRQWTNANVVSFLEDSQVSETGIDFAVQNQLLGDTLFDIFEDVECHEMLSEDFGIEKKALRLAIIRSLKRYDSKHGQKQDSGHTLWSSLTTTTKEQSKPSKQSKRPCLNTSSKVISRVTH